MPRLRFPALLRTGPERGGLLIFAAAALGYLIGSLPTAQGLGRLWGLELRTEGSGNPGTANALRTGGPWLATLVLTVEGLKGFGAVELGQLMADDAGAVAAGVGAVAGNVFNLWYRFAGGKGLGISLGVLLAAWPAFVPVAIGSIAIAAFASRSSGKAALWTLGIMVAASFLWTARDWTTGGIAADTGLVVLAVAMAAVMAPKHWRAISLKQPDRP